jgi:D-threonate/D-erythronate kinase
LSIPVFAAPYDLDDAVRTMQSTRRLVIGIGDRAATRELAPAALVDKLSKAVAHILRMTTVTRILSEGGATSAAVLRDMGWTRLEATAIAGDSVATLRPVNAANIDLLIKPGSYHWPKEIWPPNSGWNLSCR